jgi:hypothetical protein
MITPPESLVERAWKRGLDVGRYKAVDDTLGHGVEAYSGMPQLFFTWVERADKRVHFEFLDNSVHLGERPRTVAFGSQDTDAGRGVRARRRALPASERPRRRPASVSRERAPEHNAGFLRQCIDRFREVNFADQGSGRVYLSVVSGTPASCDRDALQLAITDAETRAGILTPRPQLSIACLRPTGPATCARRRATNRSTSARGDRSAEAFLVAIGQRRTRRVRRRGRRSGSVRHP